MPEGSSHARERARERLRASIDLITELARELETADPGAGVALSGYLEVARVALERGQQALARLAA
jgi:hypothetical protein